MTVSNLQRKHLPLFLVIVIVIGIGFFIRIAFYGTDIFFFQILFIALTISIILLFKFFPKKQRYELILTVILIFITFSQAWSSWYPIKPKIYGPQFRCPTEIPITGYVLNMSFGNYGEIPIYLIMNINGEGFKVKSSHGLEEGPPLETPLLLVPIKYSNNEQTPLSYSINPLNTTCMKFSLKWFELDNRNPIDNLIFKYFKITYSADHTCPYILGRNEYKFIKYPEEMTICNYR